MTRENVVRSRPVERPALKSRPVGKSREVGHADSPAALHPNLFAMQRRLKDIEARQQRTEEMLSAIFLTLEDVRIAVGATGEEPRGAGFRLPEARSQGPDRRFPWWLRAWYEFWDPAKLRRPAANNW